MINLPESTLTSSSSAPYHTRPPFCNNFAGVFTSDGADGVRQRRIHDCFCRHTRLAAAHESDPVFTEDVGLCQDAVRRVKLY